MCEETPCGRVIRKLYCAGIADVHFNTDLSDTLKKTMLLLSRNKGWKEIACIFHRPLSSKKCLSCVFQGFGGLKNYFQ